MIIQSSNVPIVLTFSEDVENIPDIRVTLWHDKQRLKKWTKDTCLFDERKLFCPLTQQETAGFPAGKCQLEVKWLDADGIPEFARTSILTVAERNDKEIMEG